MATLLRKENLIICIVYLDDVAIMGRTLSECWYNTLIVIDRLTSAGMNLSAKKCKFALRLIDILGHRFCKGVYSPIPRTLQHLAAFTAPHNKREL